MQKASDGSKSTTKTGPSKPHSDPDNPLILKIIGSNPGLNQSDLAKKLSVHRSSVQHLERTNQFRKLVTRKTIGNRTHYWLKSVGKIDVTHIAKTVLNNDCKRTVVLAVFDRPGITRSEIAIELNITLSTVSRHVKGLLGLNIIRTACAKSRTLDLNPKVRTSIMASFYQKSSDYR